MIFNQEDDRESSGLDSHDTPTAEHDNLTPLASATCGGEEGESCGQSDKALYSEDCPLESRTDVSESPLIFFSLESARQLVADRDRLRLQYEEANRKVDALAVLLPDNMKEMVFGAGAASSINLTAIPPQPSAAVAAEVIPPSLSDAIVGILDENLEVMTQDQIEEAVWDTPEFRSKEKYTPAEIAKALERISRKGRVIKRGMKYCSKNIELGADGMLPFDRPTMIQAVEKILNDADESLEAWEVIERLKHDSDMSARVKERSNGVYAALSRLVSRRIAYRDADGGYRIGAK